MLFVLGASGGLGSGLMEHLEKNLDAASKFGGYRGTTRREMDLTDSVSVTNFWLSATAALRPEEPLYIVNATGRSENGFCHKLETESWDRTIANNLTSNFHLLKSVTPLFKGRPGSSVLLFSSIVATIGVPGTIAYAAAKAGLHGFVRTAAKELSRSKATINCLELGYFDRGLITQVPDDIQKKLLNDIPLGRFGNTEDLFQACQFALTCRYLTGTSLRLNGGMA